MQWVEYEGASSDAKAQCPLSGCINFLDSIYYIVVTVSLSQVEKRFLILVNFPYSITMGLAVPYHYFSSLRWV